jgi:2,3-diaminopropionate biosynthesis protein SbnB
MRNGHLLILRGHEVDSLLRGKEREIIGTVKDAYLAHAAEESSLPHSTFLRFPDNALDRIIALPAYVGQKFGVAGVKWIASFPGNYELGMDRASAVLILNDVRTGRPEAVVEGSVISAQRTAASAALAARTLLGDRQAESVGLVGTGVINFQVARFLLNVCPEIGSFIVYDLDVNRAQHFKDRFSELRDGVEVSIAPDLSTVLKSSPLIAFATTAVSPHVTDLNSCAPGSVILHLSLRDLSPAAILGSDNIVDDIDHVCRAQTSVHLAEQLVNNRDFIRGTLGDVLTEKIPPRNDAARITVFSPFGLGVLDIAVGKLVCEYASREKTGTFIESFLPDSWTAGPLEKEAF